MVPLDINKCNMKPNPCSNICQNPHGDFKCSWPKGYEGDGLRNGKGCQRKDKSLRNLILIIGLSIYHVSYTTFGSTYPNPEILLPLIEKITFTLKVLHKLEIEAIFASQYVIIK